MVDGVDVVAQEHSADWVEPHLAAGCHEVFELVVIGHAEVRARVPVKNSAISALSRRASAA